MIDLRFVTIISNDGITIFHRSFIEDELDEYLFSGFSSAMIAFSRELGDELSLIKMEKQTIFYHEANEDGFLILSITNGYNVNDVRSKINELHKRDSLNLLLAGSRLGIIQNENEKFERDLFDVFSLDSKTSIDATDVSSTDTNEDQTIDHHRKSLTEQLEEEEEKERSRLQKTTEEDEDQAELASVLDALEDWN